MSLNDLERVQMIKINIANVIYVDRIVKVKKVIKDFQEIDYDYSVLSFIDSCHDVLLSSTNLSYTDKNM